MADRDAHVGCDHMPTSPPNAALRLGENQRLVAPKVSASRLVEWCLPTRSVLSRE